MNDFKELAGWAGVTAAIIFNLSLLSRPELPLGFYLLFIAVPIGIGVGRSRGHTWYWILNWTLWLNVFGLPALFWTPRKQETSETVK